MVRPRFHSIRAAIVKLGSPTWNTSLQAENRLLRSIKRLRRSRSAAHDLLIAATRHSNPQVRWRAAYVLATTSCRRALPDLIRLVDDPAQEVQYEALLDLGRLGDVRAIPFLAEIIQTVPADDPRRDWASVALGQLGRAALPQLDELLRSDTVEVRVAAAQALADMRVYHPLDAEIAGVLADAFADPDDRVRHALEEAFADPRARPI